MNAAPCADPDTLTALLESETGEGLREYSEHVETCPRCQQTLAALADDSSHWPDLARYRSRLQDGTGGSSTTRVALERVMVRLKSDGYCFTRAPEVTSEEDDPSPAIVRPSDRPGLLGTLDGYEVREVIGQGGMGVVLEAFDPVL